LVTSGTIAEPLAVPTERYSDLRLFATNAAYPAYGFMPATEAERVLRPLP
jgi:hypothetical protein